MKPASRFVLCSCVVGLLQLSVVSLEAEDLSLEDAIRMALSRNFKVEAAAQAVEAAAAGERMAKAEFLPELGATVAAGDFSGDVFYSRFMNPVQMEMLNASGGGTDVGEYSSTQAAVLQLTQVLYAGGASKARLSASRVERQIAEQELENQLVELAFEVTRAYFDVLLAERAVAVARQSVRRSEKTKQTVEVRLAEEEALKVEALGAESQLAVDRHQLLTAENDLELARLNLSRLLTMEPDDELQLTSKLEPARPNVEESETVNAALEHNPALRARQLEIELADVMLKGARAHFKPKLQLVGSYSRIDNQMVLKGDLLAAEMRLSIPFFKDVKAGSGAAAQARARKKIGEGVLNEARSSIRLAAKQAVRDVEESYAAVEVARKALEYQREKHRITDSAFREQLATSEDLLQESAALAEAELRLNGAHYQARLREADVARLVGRR